MTGRDRRRAADPRAADVDAGYGPFRALFGVSFAVPDGSVVALLGANGAGKTTVARVCSGLVHADRGRGAARRDDVTEAKAYQIARARCHPRAGRAFGVRLAQRRGEPRAAVPRRHSARRASPPRSPAPTSCSPGSASGGSSSPGTLSGGEQRMLALARVLVRPPRLLDRRRALARARTDRRRRGVPDARRRSRRRARRSSSSSSTCTTRSQIADRVVVLDKGQVVVRGSDRRAR